MSQHPVIFIGLLRCRAAVLSVAFLDRETEKIGTLAAQIETAMNRSNLIAVPVTGKTDVREKAAL